MNSSMIFFLRKKYGQFITSGAQWWMPFCIGVTLASIAGYWQHVQQTMHIAAGAEPESLKGWLVFLALTAVISLFTWISAMRRRRAIMNTPTSRIVSAAQGYVELRGVGRPLEGLPLLSRRTKQSCLWYRYQVEQKSGKDWYTVEDNESDSSFVIDDGSGRCMVDVEGAEITTRHKATWREGDCRYTEWKLSIDDDIYALGEFRTLGGGSVDLDARRDMGELLNEWKKDQKTLRERFDLDKDGELSEKEWGLARQAARREVSKTHIAARNASDVHTLRRPGDGCHYLISNIDPKRFARRYLLWALFHLAFFLSTLGVIPYVLH